MRSPPIEYKHRPYCQRLVGGGEIMVQANSRMVLTDELPVGDLRYNAGENTFYRGAETTVLGVELHKGE